MIKVTLGVIMASGFPVPAQFVIGYSALLQTLLSGAGNVMLAPQRRIDRARALFVQDFPIDFARNKVCRMFLDEDDGDYLLFLDADMKHPPDLAHRLVRHDRDIVTGRYVIRKPPFFTVAMRKVGAGPHDYQAIEKVDPGATGLVPIDAAGAGALLLSRKALQAVRAHLGADDWFRYQDGPDGLRSRSEDMWFFERARECGFQPYLDMELHCGHVAQFLVDHDNHKPYAEQFARAQGHMLDDRETVEEGMPQ